MTFLQVFFVHSGAVEVSIHHDVLTLAIGGAFIVPRGNGSFHAVHLAIPDDMHLRQSIRNQKYCAERDCFILRASSEGPHRG
jgi:hypothetical protein